LLAKRDPVHAIPESVLETRVLRVLTKAGLPTPASQFEIRDGDHLIARVDFAFPDLKLAVEADGYRWHSSRLRWDHDLARRNTLTALGWRVVHVTWAGLTNHPETVIHTIEQAARAPNPKA
jgi:hypothetical protein